MAKSFYQAKTFFRGISDNVLKKAVSFLKKQQDPAGCFLEHGKVLSSRLQGGLGKASRLSMTAYVISALSAHMKWYPHDKSTRKALYTGIKCLIKGRFLTKGSYLVAMAGSALKDM